MNQRTVLVGEDDGRTRELIQTVLKDILGLPSIPAADGKEVLEKAWELQPALIILDMALPGIDGLEVAKHLKSHPTTQSIPIIVVSALGVAGQHAVTEAGCEEYIPKPFEIDMLVEAVRQHLAREPQVA
ncbi:MAG: response regulator [Chloroflexota bacterium]